MAWCKSAATAEERAENDVKDVVKMVAFCVSTGERTPLACLEAVLI